MSDGLGYRINSHVVTSSFEDSEGVLIDLEGRRYYQLNETAVLIVNALAAQQQQSMSSLVAELVRRYEASETTVEASIHRALQELQALGFISPSP